MIGRDRRPILAGMKRNAGFTILELMITVALAAVVLAIGVPSFRSLVVSNQTATDANNLVSALSLARSEAISRGLCIAVVPTDADWSTGWTLGTDINCDADFGDTGEIAVRVYEGLRGSGFSAQPGTVVFQPNGGVAAPQGFTLEPSACSTTNPIRVISVGPSGIVTLKRNECP